MSDKFYKEYDERYYKERISHVSKKHMIKFIKFLLRNKYTIKWLDIGCGLGLVVKEALEEGINCYGIDISEYAVNNAIIKDHVKLGSIADIPFGDNTFDAISAFDVIEHVHPKETEKAISEMYRVLKNGGFLILTTPNPCSLTKNWIYDLTHINIRPPKYWKIMLEKHGFGVKLAYIPSFLKYYIPQKLSVTLLIPDSISFWLEEPLRYIIGWLYSRKERLYIFAKKL